MHNAAIRCNASVTGGMGNLIRQLHLANLLRDRGMEISFFVPRYQPALETLTRDGFSPHIVEPGDGLPPDAAEPFGLAILDIMDTSPELIQTLHRQCKKIASLEDLGEGRNHVDLLIDCNLEPERSKDVSSKVKTLFGLPYSILHPDFANYHERTRRFGSAPETCLITMGGTDPNRLTLRLAKLCLEMKEDLKLTVLAGPGFEDRDELEGLRSARCEILFDITDMARTLFEHQRVICSGGVTLHEALAVGTPAFAINQVPHQEKKAKTLEALGAAVNLGLAESFDQNKLAAILHMRKEELEAMSRAGKKLIDGQGIHRTADELIKLAGS